MFPKQYWFEKALLAEGWADQVTITVARAKITAIRTGGKPPVGCEIYGIAIPGMGNLHSHAFQRAMAGLTERRGTGDDSFWTWRDLMYRFTARIGPDEMWAIAAMAYAEMLESGFTRVGEFHYLHHDVDGRAYDDPAEMVGAIGSAAIETGIGLTLLPVFYAHSGFGGAPPTEGQKRFVTSLDDYVRLHEACKRYLGEILAPRLGVAPHSLRAVTPEELSVLSELAGDQPFHIHIAEQVREVEDCLAFTGQRPVEWLLGHCDVRPNWCLVHATHMTEAETTRLARSGAVAGLCPITEANLGDGIFPAADYDAQGGVWGIGTDSNVLISLSEELRLLEYGQRLTRRQRNVLSQGGSTGLHLWRQAARGGAQALGAGSTGFAVGDLADIVEFDPAGLPEEDVLSAAIFAHPKLPVRTVWRYGRRVVADGRHMLRPQIEARFQHALRKLQG